MGGKGAEVGEGYVKGEGGTEDELEERGEEEEEGRKKGEEMAEDGFVHPGGRGREREKGRREEGPLSFLCRRGDRLVPWPALAWWAATLPGSAGRGGVTVWVRLVAFAVRAVMCRAASVVAVDADSFRAAAPPDHGGFAGGDWGRGRGAEVVGDFGGGGGGSDAAGGGGVGSGGGSGGCGGGGGEDRRCSISRVQQEEGEGEEGDRGVGGGGEGRGGGSVVVVLVPTHRSYLDFVLVSLMCAAMRSLAGLSWLRVPKVAAADGPFGEEGTPLRWFMEKLGEQVIIFVRLFAWLFVPSFCSWMAKRV